AREKIVGPSRSNVEKFEVCECNRPKLKWAFHINVVRLPMNLAIAPGIGRWRALAKVSKRGRPVTMTCASPRGQCRAYCCFSKAERAMTKSALRCVGWAY